MNRARLNRANVELPVCVIDRHQITILDSEHSGEPLLNDNLQQSPLYLGDSARALDELVAASVKRDKQRELAVDSFDWPFQRGHGASVCDG